MKILRVGVLNNYNMTEREEIHLNGIEFDGEKFVNCNSFTEIAGNYPAIVTINPYFNFIEPRGNIKLIKAVRIKHVACANKRVTDGYWDSIEWATRKDIPVLLTFMRFASKKSLWLYTEEPSYYEWKNGYMRLKEKAKSSVVSYARSNGWHVCDASGTGCKYCSNCSILTYGEKADIYGISLSTSGYCKFKCQDCFAKRLINRTRTKKIAFDKVKQNAKMRKTK